MLTLVFSVATVPIIFLSAICVIW